MVKLNDMVTVELRRTGPTATVTITVLRSAVEAQLNLQELELFALFLADHVGRMRNSLFEIEAKEVNRGCNS